MLGSLEVPDEPSLARALELELELELAGQFPPGSRIIGWRRRADFFDPAAELGRMAAYGTLMRALLETYADDEPLDGRLIAAHAVDTYALLSLLGADEFADQELVDRGLRVGRAGTTITKKHRREITHF